MAELYSGTPSPQPARLAPWQRLLLGAVLAYAFLARAADLDSTPFTVDEAETGINALTILEHGLPVDHYLGQPIYENTLLQPWPESAEYEFKDSSYSARGLSVYHGWLPLYSTAASFALAGVGPDRDPSAVCVRHSAEEVRRRTAAGRRPAALFGVVFLLFVFGAARAWYGTDAAWAALSAGAVCKPVVYFAGQARYYAPTLALTAGCALLAAQIVRWGRWRDFLLGAILFVLLFHTHLLSFVSACVAFGLTVPFWARRPASAGKLAAFAAVVAAGVLPWLALSGFVGSTRGLPLALPPPRLEGRARTAAAVRAVRAGGGLDARLGRGRSPAPRKAPDSLPGAVLRLREGLPVLRGLGGHRAGRLRHLRARRELLLRAAGAYGPGAGVALRRDPLRRRSAGGRPRLRVAGGPGPVRDPPGPERASDALGAGGLRRTVVRLRRGRTPARAGAAARDADLRDAQPPPDSDVLHGATGPERGPGSAVVPERLRGRLADRGSRPALRGLDP